MDEERCLWYRDLWIFLAVFVAMPAVIVIGFLLPAVVPAVLVLAAGLWLVVGSWRRMDGSLAYRAGAVMVVLTLTAMAVAFGSQLAFWAIILVFGAS